jgi:hypothetical protein
VLCAVWWGLLKYFGAFYVGRTIDNAGEVLGQLAIVVGLLVFINLAAQLLMLTASIQAELVLGPVEAAPTVGLVEAARGHPPSPAGEPAPAASRPPGASAAWPRPPPRSPGSPAAPAGVAGSPTRSPELPAGPPAADGSGRNGSSSVRRGGGELAVGVAVQPPAALVHGTVMGAAQQHEVGEVGRAAVQPVAQVVCVTPGERPVTAGEAAAAVTHRQGDALGGRHDPYGATQLQRLGGAPPRAAGSSATAARRRAARPSGSAGWSLPAA